MSKGLLVSSAIAEHSASAATRRPKFDIAKNNKRPRLFMMSR
jgi:hypothetical protein